MKIKIKNIKLLIYNLSSLILLMSTSILTINHINKLNIMDRSNSKININYNSASSEQNNSAYDLMNSLNYVKNYLSEIMDKQTSLLYKINHSAFHTIQTKSALFIKHKYIHHANSIINKSNESLYDEYTELNNIIPILMIHPENYQPYLNEMNYIIPNINFFIKDKKDINNQNNSIKTNIYNIVNSNNLNKISLASEEATFSTKEITKSGSAIMVATFKDYHFNANIISFNKNKNLFEFMDIAKKTSDTKNEKKAKFLNLNLKNNNNSFLYQNRIFLTNLTSNNNKRSNIYPRNFDLHEKECFKTKLNFKDSKSYSKNKLTYIGLPVICVSVFLILCAAKISISGFLANKNNKKRTNRYKNTNIADNNARNTIHTAEEYDGESNYSEYLLQVGSIRGIVRYERGMYQDGNCNIEVGEEMVSIRMLNTNRDALDTRHLIFNIPNSRTAPAISQINVVSRNNLNDNKRYSIEIKKTKPSDNHDVVDGIGYKSHKIYEMDMPNNHPSGKTGKRYLIKLKQTPKNENDGYKYADITDFMPADKTSKTINLPVEDNELKLDILKWDDFEQSMHIIVASL